MSPNADFSSEPAVEGGEITLKLIPTFFDARSETTDSPMKPVAKRAKLDEGGSTASVKSNRVRFRLRLLSVSNPYQDRSDDKQGFKMRLVYRDKGCAVCLATGIQNFYEDSYQSLLFEGSHIIPFAFHELVSHCL